MATEAAPGRHRHHRQLTDAQRDLLARYAAVRHDSGVALREPLWLALVIAGEKPATFAGRGLEPPTAVPRDGWAFELTDQTVPEQELPECPNCGSQDIERLDEAARPVYQCRNCDITFGPVQ